MFGRGPSAGTLVRTTEEYDLPALQAFATQVDTAARKGAAGPELMHALVQTYIVAYQDRSLQEAEKLETRLAVPSVFFFFMPLLFLHAGAHADSAVAHHVGSTSIFDDMSELH